MKKFFFSLFLLPLLTLSALEYQLTDLGLLNYKESYATSINDQGQICGYAIVDEKNSHLFVWDGEKKIKTQKVRVSTNPVINNQGHVFGSMLTRTVDGMWEIDQEALFSYAGQLKILGYPGCQKSAPFKPLKRAVVWDVNDHQQILIMNQSVIQIDYWEKARMAETDHKIWVNDNGAYRKIEDPKFSAALKINNQGQILGCLFNGEVKVTYKTRNKLAAALYDLNEKRATLLPFESESFGVDLNELGQVAGIFHNTIKNELQGFLYDPAAELIAIDNFSPKALNNNGQIIGKWLKNDKPALWDNGTLIDLSNLSPVDDQGHTWDSLDQLIAINDQGMIIGQGKYQGATHAFLLMPH